MVANLVNLAETFSKCNNAYFEGKLPVPQFDLLHSFRTMSKNGLARNYTISVSQ